MAISAPALDQVSSAELQQCDWGGFTADTAPDVARAVYATRYGCQPAASSWPVRSRPPAPP